MTAVDKLLDKATWFKSSLSEGGGDCVEATLLTAIAVRDSKDPEGPSLIFTAAEWNAFVAAVKVGEFDLHRFLADAIG
ncbi:DUF397 domain-containing protein [Actinomadura sp. SCN-SB]|uniref:DUF397 domain-containing protein n=1 Tax=Actinomadura sp. SCN-SB TaxID=3373092 RepID=UPI003750DEC4